MKKLFALCFVALLGQSIKAHSPTWTDGIACIIYSHCSSCHNSNGIAPFSLTTYDEVYANRFSIAASVQAKSMPPFPPDMSKQRLAHANVLSQHEIDEIVDWVNNFAPLGNVADMPTPPVYPNGYELQNADVVLRMPNYTVNTVNDLYRVFVLPVGNTGTQYISEIEVVPGNRDIVHHALVYQDNSQVPVNLDANDPGPGYTAFGGTNSQNSTLLWGYTPGQKVFKYAPGFGVKLEPNTNILLQVHYPGGISNQVDSTSVRIKYASATPRELAVLPVINHVTTLTNGPLFIPANTVKTMYAEFQVPSDVTVTSVMPHMHLIGTSIKAYALTPTQDTIHLIDIPQWDFHWQGFYQFPKPLRIPANSVVHAEAVYDNTSNNPYNPNNPPQNVSAGEGTEDEMMLIYFNVSNYFPGDTNIIVDTVSHLPHHPSCYALTGLSETEKTGAMLRFYPNPSSYEVRLAGLNQDATVRLFDQRGKTAGIWSVSSEANLLKVQNLSSGLYYAQIRLKDGTVYYQKLVLQ